MRKCRKCEYGSVNLLGYNECSFRVKEVDRECIHHTSSRDKDAFIKNYEGCCKDYKEKAIEKTSWTFNIWRRMYEALVDIFVYFFH